MDPSSYTADLCQDILKEYTQLLEAINASPIQDLDKKRIEGTGGKVSIRDLIAYQIGWGKCVIRWYEAGINNKMPEMPGDGFKTWDYTSIAKHFYEKYLYSDIKKQLKVFSKNVEHILDIIEKENQTGNLNKLEIWSWCTLQSGKHWPLSKWIIINTASPYKRAALLIKKSLKNPKK
jgi:hypothetical protein